MAINTQRKIIDAHTQFFFSKNIYFKTQASQLFTEATQKCSLNLSSLLKVKIENIKYSYSRKIL